jgi:hypothetical protein
VTTPPLPAGAGAREARLHGVNLGGWLVAGAPPEHLNGFVTAADFERLVNWRFTHVRLPVDDALLDTADGWLALDRALMTCLGAGLSCVLALRLPRERRAAVFGSEAAWGRLVARWEALAGRYADAPGGLLYDLLDRPAAPDDLPPEALAALGAARPSAAAARRPPVPGAGAGRAWNALAARLTQAARSRDGRHTLMVQSNGARAAAFAHLRPTRDPNTIYGFRCFAPCAFTMQGADPPPAGGAPGAASGPVTYPGTVDGERWDRARLEALFAPVTEFRRVYRVPVYLGAFGVAAGAPRSGRLTWLRSVLSLCRAGGIGWAYWTYRGGPFALLERGGPDYDLLGVLQSET